DRLANLDTRAVHVDPRNADILIAAMSGSGIVEKNLATVYRSTDGGDTWTPRNEDLPANEPFFNENFWLYRGAEITADASGALFAVNNAKKKIHHRPPSENSRWKSVALPPPPLPPPAPRYLIAAADTARVGRFYVAFAGQSLWRTDNVGASWTQLYNGNIVSFALDRTRANQLALTSHEGILVSADAGATWRNLDAANALPYRPANHVLPLGDRVLAATSANGVFWKKINNNQNNRTIPR
ncbi:MAG: hypothetical protein LBK99_03560, partial [Opitutaceae bacterium]|nr:hypothetical protein [Opitutaceae bacterium]